MSRGHLDAAVGGAFLSLTIDGATTLINKMVSNQSWGNKENHKKDMHTVKETDMLAAKMDILMKRLERRAQNKSNEGHHTGHRLAYDMRRLWQCWTFGKRLARDP